MADALGLAASVIAVVDMAGKVTALAYDYITKVKRSRKELDRLVNELHSLRLVLISLQEYAEANSTQSTALGKLNSLSGPLQGCTRELQDLQLKLEPPRSGIRGIIDCLEWPMKEADTLQHIDRIEKHKTLFILALSTDQISLSREIAGYVQSMGLEFQVESTAQGSWRQKEDTRLQAEKRRKVLKWLYSADPYAKHAGISANRQKNTGGWLTREPKFEVWAEGKLKSRLLLGQGIPGAGKTFLSSAVVDYFKARSSKNLGVAYVYFDYKEQDQQKPAEVLSSLVNQLVSQLGAIPVEIEALYGGLEPKKQKPTLENLYAALLVASKQFCQTFLVFDALDECHPTTQRAVLLPLFRRMGDNGINVFLTSRPHPEDVEYHLFDATKLELSAREEDVVSYIQERIDGDMRALRLVRQGKCRDMIVSHLLSCANGMFLLARFQMDFLCKQINLRHLLKALEQIGSSSAIGMQQLDIAYERAIDSIRRQDERSASLAFGILSWLVKARRKLTIKELQLAMAIELDQYKLDELNITEEATLVDVCASLVVVDRLDGTVKLAHYTVQEYLLNSSVIPVDADLQLATTCGTYLSFDAFAQGPCTSHHSLIERLKLHPFLDYASRHFRDHLKACDENLSTGIFLKFLERPGNINSCLQVMGFRQRWEFSWNDYPKGRLPLHMASYFGHIDSVRLLLEMGADISARDKSGDTSLHLAAVGGHRRLVQLLLERGANISDRNIYRSTTLHWAAIGGDETVVKFLLEKGAEVSAPNEVGDTPLHWAALRGHEAVARLLIEAGADVSVRYDYGQTALNRAAENGHGPVVRLLLDAGADVSITDSYNVSALHMAASGGHEPVVQLLLDAGAEISALDFEGRTALHSAASEGHEAVVQLLLNAGAEVEALDNEDNTVLHSAVISGREAMVGLLLEAGADISASGEYGRTALHKAAGRGYEAMVRLLLDVGADISALTSDPEDTSCGSVGGYGADFFSPRRYCETALHMAASGGHRAVVQLLLEKGADIFTTNSQGGTALHEAAYEGHEAVVELLLEKGADISSRRENGETPLHQAAGQGHEVVAQLLLGKGADISSRKESGETPLHQAAKHGHEKMVQLLLEKKAEISALTNSCETALHKAAEAYQGAGVVRLLLEKGANISDQSENGETPLHKAAKRGSEALVQLLLEKGATTSTQDKAGNTPLQKAASGGYGKVVRLLLEKDMDITITVSGEPLLHWAASRGHELVVQLLLENGAEVSSRNESGETSLHLAAASTSRGGKGVVRLLIEKGADISIQSLSGETPLHKAAAGGRSEAVTKLLLERGACISSRNKNGETPFHQVVAGLGSEVIVQLLLARGADVLSRNEDGETPLHKVASTFQAQSSSQYPFGNHWLHVQTPLVFARLLLEAGADMASVNKYGDTPLHLAAERGHVEMVKLLLERGADISVQSQELGEMPLHKAAAAGCKAVVQLLLKMGAKISALNFQGETALQLAARKGHGGVVRQLEQETR